MSSGLITLVGANGTSTTLTVTRPGGHSQTDTITIQGAPGVPSPANATGQTTTTLTFPVTLNASGSLPTSLGWRWSTDNATWTAGADLTLTSPTLGQVVTETVSPIAGGFSASTLYYVQFKEQNGSGSSAWSSSVTGTTSAVGTNQLTIVNPTINQLTGETTQLVVLYGPPGYQTDVTSLATFTPVDTTVATMASDPAYPQPDTKDWVYFDLAAQLKSMKSDGEVRAFWDALTSGNGVALDTNYDGNHTRAMRVDYGAYYHNRYPNSNFLTTSAITPLQPTLAQAVTGSGSVQAVAFSSASGISVGDKIRVDSGGAQEDVTVTAVSGNNVSGIFTKSHSNGAGTTVWQWVSVNDNNCFAHVGGSGNGYNGYMIIEPTLTGGTTSTNRESFLVSPSSDTDIPGNRWRAPFTKSHASGVVYGASYDDGSQTFIGAKSIFPRTRDIYFQVTYHPGKTTTGGGLAGTEGIFEYNSGEVESTAGAKRLYAQQPTVRRPDTTLAQAITASASPQTIYLTDASFLTTPGNTRYNQVSLDGGTTWFSPTSVNKAANTIVATVNANYSIGAPVALQRLGPLAYLYVQGPTATNQGYIGQDNTPYIANDGSISRGTNINGPAPAWDSYVGSDFTVTWYAKCESAADAADGAEKLWINGTQYMDYSSINLGPNGWGTFSTPSSFRSPKFDMSEYIVSVKAWSPGKTPSAPTSASATTGSGTASITLGVDASDNGGVPSRINVYVWNGSSYVRNGNGVADISIPSTTDVRRASTYVASLTGLTSGHTYQMQFAFANNVGESGMSPSVTFTPA